MHYYPICQDFFSFFYNSGTRSLQLRNFYKRPFTQCNLYVFS